MIKVMYAASCAALLALAPALARADVVIAPDVDTWVMQQPDSDTVTVEGDFAIGTSVPENVQVVEVPKHKELGFVVVHKKRMLVDLKTHKIVKVY